MEIMNTSKRSFHARGFTLIELLVVISLIGVLASVVLASVSDGRVNAQYAVAKEKMKQISDATIISNPSGKSVLQITGNNCSDCVCRSGSYGGPANLKNIPDTNNCMISWTNAITKIDTSSDLIQNHTSYLRDPWGSPYLLDENENEHFAGECVQDSLRTAGQDGEENTADDYIIFLPFRTGDCLGK